MTKTPVRLRFAPSPTGPLHIGGARTAIYNWAAARAMGGAFVLRIEDTDRARSTAESLEQILTGLRWLGLEWDEGPEVGGEHGPYFQTERLDLYRAYAEKLLASGWAYRCYATPEEVEEGRQALAARGLAPMYDRRHRDLSDAECAEFERQGRRHALRFRMPLDEVVAIDDLCKGRVEVNVKELDDWVMVRPDGMPTYNFVVVVDDLEMAISHVVRGDEHFMNAVKQWMIYRALERPAPQFAHIPLILGPNGKKLSKRDASTNLLDYRDQGYPAAALFNYISTLGWGYSGDRDVFTAGEMVAKFRLQDIGKAGARFDNEKMLAICGHYIREMSRAELLEAVRPFLVGAGAATAALFETHRLWAENVIACFQERIQLYSEIGDKVRPFFCDELTMDGAAEKNLRKQPAAGDWLAAYAGELEALALPPSYPGDRGEADTAVLLPTAPERPAGDGAPYDTPAQLEQHAREFAAARDIKFGHLVHPVRAALSGTNKGPGLFDIIYLLGKERSLGRLRAQAAALRS